MPVCLCRCVATRHRSAVLLDACHHTIDRDLFRHFDLFGLVFSSPASLPRSYPCGPHSRQTGNSHGTMPFMLAQQPARIHPVSREVHPYLSTHTPTSFPLSPAVCPHHTLPHHYRPECAHTIHVRSYIPCPYYRADEGLGDWVIPDPRGKVPATPTPLCLALAIDTHTNAPKHTPRLLPGILFMTHPPRSTPGLFTLF
ncbi:hypothetical protein B0T14DRAFT_127162 [Immersiella caudata]|uniref:Uncharacterized protein n=1 Tax=Immersiella caudata TaxID=314043 RepID=A0AA39X4E3_9PEZI|nr:hypothetical protein B0T14DRAFT_127162 [Immersiella caudata]